MPANGGASSPNDHPGWQYPGQNRFPPLGGQGSLTSSSSGVDTRPASGGDARIENSNSETQIPPDAQIPGQVAPQRGPLPNVDAARLQQQPGVGAVPQDPNRRDGSWQHPGLHRGATSAPPASSRAPLPTAMQPRPPPSYADEDDEKKPFIARLIEALPVPSVRKLFRFKRNEIYNNFASLDAWDAEDSGSKPRGGLFGLFRRNGNKKSGFPSVLTSKRTSNDGPLPQPVQRIMDRSEKGTTTSLLSQVDKRRVRGVGKSRAMLDAASLFLLLAGIRHLVGFETIPIPNTLQEVWSLTLPGFLTAIISSLDTWAPFALAAFFLMTWTSSLLFDGRIENIASAVSSSATAEASYGRLFLRLVASTPTDSSLPNSISRAARLQVAALAEQSRLRSYITYVIATILLATVTFIRPFLVAIMVATIQIGSLPEWRSWPIPFGNLITNIKSVFGTAAHELSSLIGSELKGAGHHPMQVAFKVSILASLLAVACLPALEKRRKITPKEDNEEENTEEVSRRMAEQISDLGSSSAGRLGLLSKHGWVESTIERWRLVQDESSNLSADVSIGSVMRRLGYYVLSWFILAAPVLVFGFLLDVPVSGWASATVSKWESMAEVSLMLLFTNSLVRKTMERVVESGDVRPEIIYFLKSLAQASEEYTQQQQATPRLTPGSFNPTAGISVKDFWAAHIFKRAWAVRGAHLNCRNGEVLVLLGDDGAGKTRLLTALAESIISPPKQALTSTKVKGDVAIGGIDVTQWDRTELKKRVGLFLNDIRTLANRAEMWSGMSLEEILEPGDGLKVSDPTHTSGSTEKACMIMALKITGLYDSLLPRLPSKLSTYLSSNEEDLRPSPMRPRYNVLSPTEWSKLMLAKLIAQAIYDNFNSSGSTDRLESSLVGSLFLLDDATMMLSETEETKLLRDLRRTGVATVLSSNKWATGRLADRIAVLKDGTIVETGTHNELLNRGPQHSLYAAKWQAMTSA